MKKVLLLLLSALAAVTMSVPASAIQCVPYAREVSGINLKGDAWQWWSAAAGVYDRGRAPKDGAVLVFTRQGSMRHGHVSVVTRVINSRLVLVDHANWAPVRANGRGEVSTAVPVLDVSAKNDWSQVRVWFHPARDFGNRAYRTDGFVYHPKAEGVKRPAIHQAALHKAEELFPSKSANRAEARAAIAAEQAKADVKPEPVRAEPVKAEPVKPEAAKAIETAKPEAIKAIETAKVEPTKTELAPTVTAKIEPSVPMTVPVAKAVEAEISVSPAARVGSGDVIKVAKHAFRPRRAAGDLDALLFN